MNQIDEIKSKIDNLPESFTFEVTTDKIKDIYLLIHEYLEVNNVNYISIKNIVNQLQGMQINGVKGVKTYAELLLLSGSLNQVYIVGKDPDSSKNGWYHWDGGYIKHADITTGEITPNNTFEPINGKSVIEYFKNSIKPLFQFKRELNSATLNESECTWSTESSTFSAWGWGVGTRDPFNIIKLKIRGWSTADPITQINVRVRENNYSGNILAEKMMSINDVVGEDLYVDFENVIDTNTPLYIEYLTDGRIGRFNIGVNLDIGQGSVTTNYLTNKSLTAEVHKVVSSNAQAPIFVEFYKLKSDIELTQQGKSILGQQLEISSFVPRINLPDKINATVGYAQQLFFRGMIEAVNPYRWNIKVKGDVGGKQYPRYYQFTPTSTGDKTFTIELWDDENKLVTSKDCTISVSNPITNPSSLKKVLCIGDSLTSGGSWTGELARMLKQLGGDPVGLKLSNIELIGTVGSGDNKYEGYGGKRWSWYIEETSSGDIDVEFVVGSHDKNGSDIASFWQDSNGRQWRLETIVSSTVLSFSRSNHTNAAPSSGTLTHVSGATNTNNVVYTSISGGAVNPFWNSSTNQLDIQNYINSNSFGGVDYVISLLTWNGMKGGRKTAADHQDLIDDAKIWIDKLHSQYPNCKVLLLGIPLPSHNGGLAHNYGDATSNYGNLYDLNQTVFGLNLAYQELANDPAYASFVKFENVSAQFDSENNLPETDRPVNLRSTKTEKIGINGLHPTTEGYMQIADVAFKAFNSLL